MLRPMTRPIAAALIAISFSAFASAQEVNEHLQVFVTGAMSGHAFTAPFLASDSVSDLDVARNIQPGIEVVFKPQSRVSFGASFQKQVFAQKLTETTPFDWFYYIGQDGDRHLVSLPGTVLFSYETSSRHACIFPREPHI